MVSATKISTKRCTITVSIDGYTKSGLEEHEKINDI
jgi:hypothetical protein